MWRYRCVSSAGRHPKTNDSCVTAAEKWCRPSVEATPPITRRGGEGFDSCITTSFIPFRVLWVMLCVGAWPSVAGEADGAC